MARRPRLTAVLATAVTFVVAAACVGQSNLSGGTQGRDAPGARAVSGRLIGPDGTPARGVTVYLARRPGVAEILFDVLAAGVTLGLACAQPGLAVCDFGADTVTDADGRFEFTSRTGTDERLGVVAQLPAGAGRATGPGLAADFTLATPAAVLPELRFWDPALDLRGVDGAAQLAWEPLDDGSSTGEPARYRASFADGSGRPVLGLSAGWSSARFDARLLEDVRGTVAVTAAATVGGESGGAVAAKASYTSAGLPFAGGAGVPASRSRPCPGPCPLTDGDLTTAVAAGTATGPVDLGQPRPIDLVVQRGGCLACGMEFSTDAVTWRPLGGRPIDAASSGGVRAVSVTTREVRLVRLAPGSAASATELSLWERTRPADAAPVVNGPVDDRVAAAASARRASGVSGGWILAAGLLLGAVAAAAGTAVSRRRVW
ncbi:MAG: hypothetical protein ACRDZW_03135 [Acidimicrobiales bacterium]